MGNLFMGNSVGANANEVEDGRAWPIIFVQILLGLNLLAAAMGAYALSSLFEVLIYVSFLCSARLRLAFVQIVDLRVWLLFSFLLSIGVAMIWAVVPWEGRLEELFSWRKVFLFPFALAVFQTHFSRARFAEIFFWVASVIMLTSWVVHLTEFPAEWSSAWLMENDVVQSVVFSISSLLGIFLLSLRRKVFDRKGLLITSIVALGFLNIFFVGTGRSGYLFVLVSALVFTFLNVQKYRWTSTLLLLGAVIAVIATSSVATSQIELGMQQLIDTYHSGDGTSSSMGIRLVMWINTWEMIREAPILGTGSGGFRDGYGSIVNWVGDISDDPHNQFLHVWAEQGLVSLLLLILFLASCLVGQNPSITHRLASALVCGFCATSMFSGHMATFVEGRLFWTLLGVLLAGTPLFGNYRLRKLHLDRAGT